MKKFTLITLLLMSVLAMAQDRTIRRGGGGGGGGSGSIADFNAQFGTDAAGKYILTNGASITNLAAYSNFTVETGSLLVTAGSVQAIGASSVLIGRDVKLPFHSANRALYLDSNSLIASSATTDTELGYVSGVTSALQTQISGKQASDTELGQIAALSMANGDILYYNSGFQKLVKGSDTQVLTLASGLPSWVAAGGGITFEATQFGSANGFTNILSGANVTNLVHQGDFDLNGGMVMLNTANIRGDDSANTTIEISGDTITFTAAAGDGMTYDSSGLTILTDDLTLDSGSLNVSAASVSANGFVDTSATGNFALATDGSLNIVESASTATELGYLSGVTSGIQAQLNAKGTVGDVAAAMIQATKWEMIVPFGDESTSHTTGTKFTFNMPRAITLTGVKVNLNTAATGATLFTVDLHEAGVSVLSTKITLTSGSRTSVGAATAPVISDSALADDAIMTVEIDFIGNTLPGVGGKLTLIGTRN
tara:strand:- start:394 stop:1839 length:1446 start_codon:yes stop_codon:yes gene_type:complete